MRASLRQLFRVADPPFAQAPMRESGMKRRFRAMMQHTRLLTVAGLLLCTGLGGVAYYYMSLPTSLTIAVGPANSDDVRVVDAFARQLVRERATVRLVAVPKDGPRAAATALDKGEADLAIVRRDIAMPTNGQAIAILRKNVAVLFAPAPPAAEPEPAKPEPAKPVKGKGRKAAAAKKAKAAAKNKDDKSKDDDKADKNKIDKIEDLVGRRIGIIGRTEANLNLLKIVLAQYGIGSDKVAVLSTSEEANPNAPDKVSVVQLEPYNVTPAIRGAKVDAILSVGPVSSLITAEAIAAVTRKGEPPSFIEIKAAEAIAERNPVYESTEIKAGAFGGSPPRPEESIDTIGINHYIVANRKLSEGTVAEFTRLLFTNRTALAGDLLAAAKLEAPDTDKDAAVPVHPGAVAYLGGDVKTFFDRYSDLLYWGLMVFSFFGSALAGLASFNKADDRVRRLKALERLLEITRDARNAETAAALDAMQSETDDILGGMIDEVEHDTLDETAMMAFQVSIEQCHLAISDGRANLVGQPARVRPVMA